MTDLQQLPPAALGRALSRPQAAVEGWIERGHRAEGRREDHGGLQRPLQDLDSAPSGGYSRKETVSQVWEDGCSC